jgi:hypothetical protein
MNSELAPAPVSGRRRAAQRSAAPRRWPWPRLLAAVIALAGIVVVVIGGLQASVFAPSTTTQATLTGTTEPVITTAVGALGLKGPRVQVDVTDAGRRPVFVGIGRAADVDAYLARVARREVDGEDGEGTLLTRRIGSEPALPDPAGVDVWVTTVRGAGSANLAWPDAPGQWRLMVSTDGTAKAPSKLSLTWSGRELHSSAPALIAVGLVLAVAGFIALVILRARSKLDADA